MTRKRNRAHGSDEEEEESYLQDNGGNTSRKNTRKSRKSSTELNVQSPILTGSLNIENRSPRSEERSEALEWRPARENILRKYGSQICNIDRKNIRDITEEQFEKDYRFIKPLIVSFSDGAKSWTDPERWTISSLIKEYGDWLVSSGNSMEIVRRGGNGDIHTSFNDFVTHMIRQRDNTGEPLKFYNQSSLPRTLKPPSIFKIVDGIDDSIFFLGASGSGVTFHKHADSWNGPESFYHGTINIGDTVAMGIQKKKALTDVEKLFYKDNQFLQEMQGKISEEERNKIKQDRVDLYMKIHELLPSSAEVCQKIAGAKVDVDDIPSAIKFLELAIEKEPYFVNAYIDLGKLLARKNRLEEAEDNFKKALALNKKLWDVYAGYGDVLLQGEKFQEAIDIYRQGFDLRPDMVSFLHHIREAFVRMGDQKGARRTEMEIGRHKMRTRR
ncbi:hypothetical protein KUTeg_024399 [Tegillarca granosa]|uniref:Uncharacterized protein n=1 Tax=Tegillarca granosa TaxID=220873 RepID=A0ABQ9E3J4_TEGGR|nr:hypothetical protein KUTeg_024399 [Tegillarca granosa]